MLVEASFLGDLKVGEEDWKMGGANIKVGGAKEERFVGLEEG